MTIETADGGFRHRSGAVVDDGHCRWPATRGTRSSRRIKAVAAGASARMASRTCKACGVPSTPGLRR